MKPCLNHHHHIKGVSRSEKGRSSRDNRERASYALCSVSPCGTTAHERSKNGNQGNEKEKITHCAKKAKSRKKQEGTNKRCPEGLTTDLGSKAPQGRHSLK